MNLSDMIVTMSQASEIEQPGLFPFPFDLHVIFACIALVFMVFQFCREKKPYQLIMAVAIPFSLVIWLSENRTLFYTVGIVEAVLFLAAFVTAIIFRKKDNENAEDADENDTSSEKTAEEESSEEEPASEIQAADEAPAEAEESGEATES